MTAPTRQTGVVRNPSPQSPASPTAATAATALQRITTERARKLIEPMLKPGVTIDRVFAETYFAIQKSPELIECTAESLIMAVAQCAAWDLTIGETVHLMPFNTKVKDRSAPNGERWENRAQAVRDYKGDIELVVRSGAARSVDAQCVYENELFEYEQGSSPFIKHRPERDPKRRGRLLGAYAVAHTSRLDPPKIVYMSVEEIDAIRLRLSKQWKNGTLEAIPWYARKTVVHQVTKLIPKNPRLAGILKTFALEDDEVAAVPDGEVAVQEYQLRGAEPAEPEQIADELAPPAAEPLDAFRMPFSWRGVSVGTALRDVPLEELNGAYEWAKANNPKGYLNEFIDKAAIVTDDMSNAP